MKEVSIDQLARHYALRQLSFVAGSSVDEVIISKMDGELSSKNFLQSIYTSVESAINLVNVDLRSFQGLSEFDFQEDATQTISFQDETYGMTINNWNTLVKTRRKIRELEVYLGATHEPKGILDLYGPSGKLRNVLLDDVTRAYDNVKKSMETGDQSSNQKALRYIVHTSMVVRNHIRDVLNEIGSQIVYDDFEGNNATLNDMIGELEIPIFLQPLVREYQQAVEFFDNGYSLWEKSLPIDWQQKSPLMNRKYLDSTTVAVLIPVLEYSSRRGVVIPNINNTVTSIIF